VVLEQSSSLLASNTFAAAAAAVAATACCRLRRWSEQAVWCWSTSAHDPSSEQSMEWTGPETLADVEARFPTGGCWMLGCWGLRTCCPLPHVSIIWTPVLPETLADVEASFPTGEQGYGAACFMPLNLPSLLRKVWVSLGHQPMWRRAFLQTGRSVA
jgi:hypothetical protein